MDKLFCVTSGKGGVGKSTVSVGLAAAFSLLGQKVLLLDLDEGLRCLDLMLGVSENIACDLGDVLAGRDVADATYALPGLEGVSLIPAPLKLGNINPVAFGELISDVITRYDRVIIDFPAGIDFTLYETLPKTATFLVVCTPDSVCVRDAYFVGNSLSDIGFNAPRLILNRFSLSYINSGIYKGVDDIIDASGIRLGGVIPFDQRVPVLQSKSKAPMVGRTKKAFIRLARRLSGEDIKLPKPKKI